MTGSTAGIFGLFRVPAGIDTREKLLADEASRQRSEARHPTGRNGMPEDVAYGVLYLASDECSFVTGSELVINGGLTAQ